MTVKLMFVGVLAVVVGHAAFAEPIKKNISQESGAITRMACDQGL
jgi:hypothetical protein